MMSLLHTKNAPLKVSSYKIGLNRNRVALFIVSGYLLGSLLLILLTKLTLNRNFLYFAYLGSYLVFGAVFLLVGDHWKRSSLTIWWWLFIFLVAIQILNPNTTVLAGLVHFATKYSMMLMYPIIVLVINRPEDLMILMRLMVVCVFLSVAYTLYQEIIGYPTFEDNWAYSLGNVHGVTKSLYSHRRPPGLLTYSASNAAFLTILTIMTLPFFVTKKWGWGKALSLLGFSGISILFTQTRGVWVGLAIGLFYFFLKVSKSHHKKTPRPKFGFINTMRLRVYIVFIVLIILGVTAVLSNSVLLERISGFTKLFEEGSPFLARVKIWQMILSQYWEGLFLGYGTGSVGTGGSSIEGASQRLINLADNMYFNVVFSFGIFGLMLLFLILGQTYFIHKQNWRVLNSPFLRLTSLSVMSGILAYAVFFITGDYLESFPANLYFWAGLGIISILPRLDKMMARRSESV